MCSVHALVTSAIARLGEDEDIAEESLTFEFVQWFYPLSLKVNTSLPNAGLGRSTTYIKSSRSWYLVSLSVSWRRLKRTSW
jgi:hypothetical protein